jgi:WD40 repeat protein
MADVFVSYARVDAPFVRKLHDALRAREREAWVDLDDIPPSAEWLKEVFSGIEGSDTFVFVLSPDSVRSDVCGLELRHALGHDKRIVPIVASKIDAAAVPPSLATLNWVDFTLETEFPASLERLLQAVDTDLDFVKQHTRLLVRALEWDRAGRDRSLTLRGRDLTSATQWLDRTAADPKLTASPLHAEYIAASRNAETRRKRIMATAAAFAVVVASGLALLAELQRRAADRERTTAVQERATAVRERTTAISRELAAVAISQASADPELAILLASEAVHRASTVEAEDALRHALSASNGRAVLPADKEYASAAGFSSEGKFVVTVGGDDSARIWDPATGRELRRIQHGSSLDTAWFSPSSTYLVTVGDNGRSRVWRADSGTKVAETGSAARGAFSKDESWFVTSGEEDAALWDARTWRKIRTMEDGTTVSTFSEDGRVLLVVDSDAAVLSDPSTGRTSARLEGEFTNAALTPGAGVVALTGDDAARIWHVAAKKVVSLPGTCDEIAISSDGRLVATAHEDEEDGIVRLWDAHTGKPIAQVRGRLSRSAGRAFSRDGNLLVTPDEDNTAVVWNTRTGDSLAVLRGHRESVNSAAFDPSGTYVVTASDDGDARLWALSGARLRAVLADAGNVRAIVFSPKGDAVITAGEHAVLVWDVRRAQVTSRLAGNSRLISAVAFSGDGRRVITGGADSPARVWDAATGAPVATLSTGPVTLVALNPDGQRALTTSGNNAVVWDTSQQRTVSTLSGHDKPIALASFAPDGQSALTAAIDGSVRLWDVATGRARSELHAADPRLPPVGSSRIEQPLFALTGFTASGSPPGGDRLFALGEGAVVRVWDVAARQVVSVLRGHTSDVTSVAFDGRGRFVATSSDDRSVRIWEARTGRAVAVLRGHRDFVNAAAFAPDGTVIGSGGFDETALIYECEVCGDAAHLLELAKARVTRTLTDAERQEYLPADAPTGVDKASTAK